MSWLSIGYCVFGPNTKEVSIGRMAGELLNGILHLRISYHGSESPDPLSFYIVDFLNDDGVRSVDSVKFWPKGQPSACRLGPCPEVEVVGRVLIRARSLNARRLLSGFPAPVAPLSVQAFLPAGTTFPRFTPAGIQAGEQLFNLTGAPVGPGGAHPVGLSNA